MTMKKKTQNSNQFFLGPSTSEREELRQRLMSTIRELRQLVREGNDRPKESETKRQVVIRLLSAMGWRVRSRMELQEETTLQNSRLRADLMLYHAGTQHVAIVEIKRTPTRSVARSRMSEPPLYRQDQRRDGRMAPAARWPDPFTNRQTSPPRTPPRGTAEGYVDHYRFKIAWASYRDAQLWFWRAAG